MQLDRAVVTEQGVTFAIVVVRNTVLDSPFQREEAQISLRRVFPRMPLILMGQDGFGVPRYFGRVD